MNSQLLSLSKIFTERLFRIPDYQWGYAWTDKHIKDFWNDLVQLPDERNHYTGVLTLEEVPQSTRTQKSWRDDAWIIDSKSFAPFYVVDGQQRLTTTIILIQSILENLPEGSKLNYTTYEEIRKRFIFDSKNDGISRSYIFGYDEDNPSYEFLKTQIFLEHSDEHITSQETIYTQNLINAKNFFIQKLADLSLSELEQVYKKLTQHFLFNIYTISEEIDVFVAFESMNNRGKPLSHLELLKNRLIYLSTKFSADEHEKTKLRNAINECWKSMYHYLGKNKSRPLNDDTFLFNHFSLRFGEKYKEDSMLQHRRILRRSGPKNDYQEYLLEKEFTFQNIDAKESGESKNKLKISDVYAYVQSLKESVEIWYQLLTPNDSSFSEDEKYWLEKLNRIGILSVAPVVMVVFQRETSVKNKVRFLKSVERYLFVMANLVRFGGVYLDFTEMCQSVIKSESNTEKLTKYFESFVDEYINGSSFLNQLISDFRNGGFYRWHSVRYFLYEYELSLREASKTHRGKLIWDEFSKGIPPVYEELGFDDRIEDNRDYHTVEHIYPQNPRKSCWISLFKQYTDKEKSLLKNSLGNLVPLSQPKNSSFQNNCFEDKKGKTDSTVGFRYGSFSENEVANYPEWTADQIAERGIKMLEFLEKRWRVSLGDKSSKLKILGVDFVASREK